MDFSQVLLGSLLALIVLAVIVTYNMIIGRKNQVENAEGSLNAQLKKRYDLIPNLVSTVQTFMTHEKEVLDNIVKLRTQANNIAESDGKNKEKINKEISQCLSRIMINAEQYPELKSSQNFVNLQNALYDVELNIAAARRFFNSSVTLYNNALEMFPSNIIASMMKLQRKEVFNIPEVERQNPNVANLFSKAG